MPDLFQNFLNQVGGAYRQADKKLGGWLPGGGAGNPLSNVVKPSLFADVVGYGLTGGYPAPTLPQQIENTLVKKLIPTLQSQSVPQTIRELPRLLQAANKTTAAMNKPGFYAPEYPGFSRMGPRGISIDLSETNPTYMFGGPHFMPGQPNIPFLDTAENSIRVGMRTPTWITAHEMGHAIDFLNRPQAFAPTFKNPGQYERYMENVKLAGSSPGALVFAGGAMKDDDRSLLGAGIQGALSGLGANRNTLVSEYMADKYGKPLAKSINAAWDPRANALAKGTYINTAVGQGFVQGVVGELLNRGVNLVTDTTGAVMDASRGGGLSQEEQGLLKYGYNPKTQTLVRGGTETTVKPRSPWGQAVYEYMVNPNKPMSY